MKTLLRNVRIVLAFFLILSIATLIGLVIQQRRSETHFRAVAGENKQILRERYRQAGQIIAADGVILADSSSGERKYASDPAIAEALLQTVGDYTHNIVNTVESQLQGPLLGNRGNLLKQLNLDVRGLGFHGDDVLLTISASLSKRAYQQLGGHKGAVVLLNYETGDIIVSVSSPSTSPENVIRWQNIPESALFNRALNGRFAPGSTFKVITAAAWLQSPAYDPHLEVHCQGDVPVVPSGAFENHSHANHGTVDLSEAFAQSCNIFFGQVGMNTGPDLLEKEAASFGVGQPLGLPYLSATTSRIAFPRHDRPLLSWAAIGQPAGETVLTMSPLHLAMIAGGVGNGGAIMTPHVVGALKDPLDAIYDTRRVTPQFQLPSEIVISLDQLMTGVVEHGTGRQAGVSGHKIGGKTGTVQMTDESGGESIYSLFIGYDKTPGYPYAIAVVIDNKGYSAAQIAGNILANTSKIEP